MKKLKNLKGAKELSKAEQRTIKGGIVWHVVSCRRGDRELGTVNIRSCSDASSACGTSFRETNNSVCA